MRFVGLLGVVFAAGAHAAITENQATAADTATMTATDWVLSNWTTTTVCDDSLPMQFFTRQVITEATDKSVPCPPLTKMEQCQPIHCEMSEWSAWTACLADGSRHRSRSVVQSPALGGRECPSSTDSVLCCEKDCLVSDWGPWQCDRASGNKTRTRTEVRAVKPDGAACPSLTETAPCDAVVAPSVVPPVATPGVCDAVTDANEKARCAKAIAGSGALLGDMVFSPSESVVAADTLWACFEICAEKVGCLAYVYDGPNRNCGLVTDSGYRQNPILSTRGIVAATMLTPRAPPPTSATCREETGKRFVTSGSTVRSSARQLRDCCKNCIDYASCKAFKYDMDGDYCDLLLSTVTNVVEDSFFTSGTVIRQ